MKTFLEMIKYAVDEGAEEIFLLAGQPVMYRKNGGYFPGEDDHRLTPDETEKITKQAYEIPRRSLSRLAENRDDRFVVSIPGVSRVRVSAYFQRSSAAMTARIIPFSIPDPETAGIPQQVMSLADLKEGLVLVCSPASGGKSTTMACLVDKINHSRHCHILTVESPIEYLYKNDKAFVSQREVFVDTESFEEALKASRWQSPDVLVLSEIDNGKVLKHIMDASENKLVISCLNARSRESAIRQLKTMLDPADTDAQEQLTRVLKAVVCQSLAVTENGFKPEFIWA